MGLFKKKELSAEELRAESEKLKKLVEQKRERDAINKEIEASRNELSPTKESSFLRGVKTLGQGIKTVAREVGSSMAKAQSSRSNNGVKKSIPSMDQKARYKTRVTYVKKKGRYVKVVTRSKVRVATAEPKNRAVQTGFVFGVPNSSGGSGFQVPRSSGLSSGFQTPKSSEMFGFGIPKNSNNKKSGGLRFRFG